MKDLLGHETLEMTLRYAHLAPQHSAQAVKRLAGLIVPAEPSAEAAQLLGRARGEHAVRGRQSAPSKGFCKTAGLKSGGGGNRTARVGKASERR